MLLPSTETLGQENTSLFPPIRDESVRPADFQRELAIPKLSATENLSLKNEPDTAENEGSSSPFAINDWLNTFSKQTRDVDFLKVASSLAIVIGGYLIFVWLTRKLGATGSTGLPSEVVEVLGQTHFGQKKQLQLVRLGSKLLLLLNSYDGTTQTIGEITDPHEVDYLTSVCGNKKTSRSAIAISKATSSNQGDNASGGELKRVLRQLQRTGERNGSGTVFDA